MELTDRSRLLAAARSFATRNVSPSAFERLVRSNASPRPGDLVLARIDSLGHHRKLQLPDGRRRNLFVEDEILLAYGNRYAPKQFEAIVPQRLEPCHLVAGGGIAAKALSWHARIMRGPTCITPLGFVADAAGHTLNLADFALPGLEEPDTPRPTMLTVLGTSMDAGKSTMAAFLIKGLTKAGLRVGFAKLTGTGAGDDLWLARDAGAEPVLDFTDVGFASTYRLAAREVERIGTRLLRHLHAAGADVAVIEVADGLFQPETAALVRSDWLRERADGVLFAAPDALGAAGGVQVLTAAGLTVMGVGGVLTSAPLQEREAVLGTRLPVLGRSQLADPATAKKLFEQART
ncbi:MAG: dethiobiotin synthase [Myxococcota bacterium]|nr:dethiobiotin synthase [Myxococcota bacterium]